MQSRSFTVPRMFVASVLTAMIFSGVARADSSVAQPLTVSPAIVEWIASKGETQHRTITVSNNSNVALPVSAVAARFDLQQSLVGGQESIYNAAPWIVLTDPDIIVEPHATRQTEVVLHVPANASPGGHYATVYFRQLVPASAGGLRVAGRVGALQFIIVRGPIHVALSARGPLALGNDDGKRVLRLTLQNDGNSHTLPHGRVIVKDWHGKLITQKEIEKGVLLPHTRRTYTIPLPSSLPLFSRLTAYAEITYDNNAHVPVRDTTAVIWLFPWRSVCLVLLVGLLGLILYRSRRRWKLAWRALQKEN